MHRTGSSETTTDTNQALKLRSLAPAFNADQHGVYVEALEDAIEHQPELRNIALTGAYGTGKSSILAEVANRYESRVVELSLSTVGDDLEQSELTTPSNPVATTTTNRIQKEIVKQILYKEAPRKTRGSRFRRIARFSFFRELGFSMLAAILLLAVLYISGTTTKILASAALDSQREVLFGYAALFVLGTLTVLWLRWLTHNRVFLEKLTAGPATVTLSANSTSYFDDYLDEMVYYFEVSGRDLVIFEDIDRFNDVHIFETLRSLNAILNGSHQVRHRRRTSRRKGRPVKFIYALRDSVFEKLGREDDSQEVVDEARAEIERANRTKFFDLVVPVVPFITHRNARDLMSQVMKGTDVSPDLIDLAARHVAEMRLIRNLRNEFDVFYRRLLSVKAPLPGLDSDRLFALVLYKNVHMSDFEAIRFGVSNLDKLHDEWRRLVEANMDAETDTAIRINRSLQAIDGLSGRSARLGNRLQDLANALVRSSPYNYEPQILVGGVARNSVELRDPEVWKSVLTGGQIITINVAPPFNNPVFQVKPSDVAPLLGERIDVDQWNVAERDRLMRLRTTATRNIEFLRHHTWQQIYGRSQFRQSGDGEGESFRGITERLLDSQLARDLVANGYINDYFALHISVHYGERLRTDALNYIVHSVDRGVPQMTYSLTGDDVDAIISDKGSAILRDRSMYNVSVLDHLLSRRQDLAHLLVTQVAAWGKPELDFVSRYFTYGAYGQALSERLAPLVPSIYDYLVNRVPVDNPTRVKLIDSALPHWSDDQSYSFDDSLRAFIEEEYPAFSSITSSRSESDSRRSVEFIASVGAKLLSAQPLNAAARAELVAQRAYVITDENLKILTGSSEISLDSLMLKNREVYEFCLTMIDKYLDVVRKTPGAVTVSSPENFATVITDAAARVDEEALVEIVKHAEDACRLLDIAAVPEAAWRAIVRESRIPATFSNALSYFRYVGEVDDGLARLLQEVGKIADAEDAPNEERLELAMAILRSKRLIPQQESRVRLVESLQLDKYVAASEILPESGEWIGLLIEYDVIADSKSAFSEALMVDWATREFAISKSKKFAEFVSPDIVPATEVQSLLESERISTTVKQIVIKSIDKYAPDASGSVLLTVARLATSQDLSLDYQQLEFLRARSLPLAPLLDLVARAADLPVDDLRALLRSVGGNFAKVADPGVKRPLLAANASNRMILDRLKVGGIVSRYEPIGNGTELRIYLKRGTG